MLSALTAYELLPRFTSSNADDPKSVVQKGYDTCAPKYFAWQSSRPAPKALEWLPKLFAHLKSKAQVLELGCGPGVPYTQLLVDHELELQVTAVDISASQIALARDNVAKSPRVEFVHADMTKLEYPEASFDAVIAFYSLFHLPREEQGPMVKMITRWLKPGGVLLFNLAAEEGDRVTDDWMGVKMFSTGLGVEGNNKMVKEFGEGTDFKGEVLGEKGGLREEVFFHWFWAIKE